MNNNVKITRFLGVYFFGVGSITIVLKILAEASNPNLSNLYLRADKLGYGSILAGILFYLFGLFMDSLRMKDNFEVNFKRIMYKIDRLICKNLILAIIFVVILFLLIYKMSQL